MLKPRCDVTNRSRDPRINGVSRAACRRCMMRFIEDQERAWPQIVQPVAKRPGVSFVDQQLVRDQEAWERRPRIHTVASFLPDAFDVEPIEHFERKAEARLHLVLPLLNHRWRAGDDNLFHFTTEE